MIFYVADVDVFWEHVRGKGLQPERPPPATQDWANGANSPRKKAPQTRSRVTGRPVEQPSPEVCSQPPYGLICNAGMARTGYCGNVGAYSETTPSLGTTHGVAWNSAATPCTANCGLKSRAGHPRSMNRESQASLCTELSATVTSRM